MVERDSHTGIMVKTQASITAAAEALGVRVSQVYGALAPGGDPVNGIVGSVDRISSQCQYVVGYNL